MGKLWEKYGKAILATLFAAVYALQAALSDERVTQQEGVGIAIAVVTALGVWWVPILHYPGLKSGVAAALAALNMLATLVIGGISGSDATALILAGLTALGVSLAPARSDPAAPVPPAQY